MLKHSDVYQWLRLTKIGRGRRQRWLEEQLENYLDFEKDEFGSRVDPTYERKLTNYYIKSKEPSNKFLVAHWDVVDVDFCANDNSASVINLLIYGVKHCDVNIAILDGEEYPHFGAGSKRLSALINDNQFGEINNIYNFELTGVGCMVVIGDLSGDTHNRLLQSKFTLSHSLPFSDSNVFKSKGLDSEVSMLIPKIKGKMRWEIIGYCHSSKDNWEIINIEDMENFTDYILPDLISR